MIGHATTDDATDPPGMATVRLRCGGILDCGDGSKESGVEVQLDVIGTGSWGAWANQGGELE